MMYRARKRKFIMSDQAPDLIGGDERPPVMKRPEAYITEVGRVYGNPRYVKTAYGTKLRMYVRLLNDGNMRTPIGAMDEWRSSDMNDMAEIIKHIRAGMMVAITGHRQPFWSVGEFGMGTYRYINLIDRIDILDVKPTEEDMIAEEIRTYDGVTMKTRQRKDPKADDGGEQE